MAVLFRELPSREVLLSFVECDPDRGELTWRPRDSDKRWTTRYAGKLAGSMVFHDDGRPMCVKVIIQRLPFMVHRIVWFLGHGNLASNVLIDHRDMNPFNNRLDNLRIATRGQNNANSGLSPKNTSGFKGVVRSPNNSFIAQIIVKGKHRYLGTFPTVEMAAQAYRLESEKLYGEFSRCEP